MGENIIILFIFFLLLIFGVVFYSRIQSAKTEQKIAVDVEGRGLQIAQKISFLPELQCTKDNAEIAAGCYDLFSAEALKNLAANGQNTEYYSDIFGFSKVSIKEIFPEEKDAYVIYDNKKETYNSILTTNTPITLCDFVTDLEFREQGKCSFAVLKVEIYD